MTTTSPNRIVANDYDHLTLLVREHMKQYSYSCDLNHIDVSQITDMKNLFAYSWFTGEISQWDVSNVVDMSGMFGGSMFNGDISSWNTSACTNFSFMFAGGTFNNDISNWNMGNAKTICTMFSNSKFSRDVSCWNVPLSCDTTGLFLDNPAGLKAQRYADWHAKLHVDNGTLPGCGLLLSAFEELKGIHEGLGSSSEERARDVVQAVTAKRQGLGAGTVYALPELM